MCKQNCKTSLVLDLTVKNELETLLYNCCKNPSIHLKVLSFDYNCQETSKQIYQKQLDNQLGIKNSEHNFLYVTVQFYVSQGKNNPTQTPKENIVDILYVKEKKIALNDFSINSALFDEDKYIKALNNYANANNINYKTKIENYFLQENLPQGDKESIFSQLDNERIIFNNNLDMNNTKLEQFIQ